MTYLKRVNYSQRSGVCVNIVSLALLHFYCAKGTCEMNPEIIRRVVMVTGATSGIGRATAGRFAAAGDHIVAFGRDRAALEEVEQEISTAGGTASAMAVDVTIESDLRRAFDAAISKTGRLHVLVNAAGHISNGSIEDTSLDDWDAMMNVNLRSVFYLMQMATPHLVKTGGSVVNVSSVTGLRSFPGVLAYCVSKAGVDQLTRCSALELAAKGVRVNAVNPGVVITEIHKRGGMTAEAYETFLERSKTTHPIGRVGEASEIAELIFFLASDKASWITGGTYQIDGGRALTCAR